MPTEAISSISGYATVSTSISVTQVATYPTESIFSIASDVFANTSIDVGCVRGYSLSVRQEFANSPLSIYECCGYY